MRENIGLILLAAGNASRLGESKQLLPYKSSTLLGHAAGQAVQSKASPVVVVLGARCDEHRYELRDLPVLIAYNPNWERGIGTSIVEGLLELEKQHPSVKGVVLMVCDQPYISSSIIDDLIKKAASSAKGIIASTYAGTIGTPALFKHSYFIKLKELKEDQGAKVLLKAFKEDIEVLQFPEGAIDIDTKTDYINLKTPNQAKN
ncbi:nucleotidyltransferase family protein [Desertivirga brevis]|uniref:nucleotidyltransferase family protein n=1 Tax=Desertivirga brevis TaxID=2810310 RepID=UPI001A958E3A|nr:nucleotidyltransferase family protein [Pedobacter sp. SYSU D00873]